LIEVQIYIDIFYIIIYQFFLRSFQLLLSSPPSRKYFFVDIFRLSFPERRPLPEPSKVFLLIILNLIAEYLLSLLPIIIEIYFMNLWVKINAYYFFKSFSWDIHALLSLFHKLFRMTVSCFYPFCLNDQLPLFEAHCWVQSHRHLLCRGRQCLSYSAVKYHLWWLHKHHRRTCLWSRLRRSRIRF